ncbi:MAG: protein kinase [candidate division Zixibacteria bacterium]|nr:protein kinase [candidate division Zixibacteria bacterium]
MIGTTVSHYRITAKLGEGGMGVVYLATDLHLGRQVALKFLAADRSDAPQALERFFHEARAAAMLNHPNIVTCYEIGQDGHRAFIAMEYVEGMTLAQMLRVEQPPLPDLLDFAIDIGVALQAAHEKGIIHRDIKPQNVMVTAQGQVKVTDFGLAKWKGIKSLTSKADLLGTVQYSSPEQACGRKLDHRSDVFSFGVLLYEMLSGQPPFRGESASAVIYEITNRQPQPLARFCRDLPDQLEHVVSRAVAKKPEERYQSMAGLVADLKSVRATPAVSEVSSRSVARKRSLPRWAAPLIAVFLLAAIGIGGYAMYQSRTTAPVKRETMVAVLPFENLGSSEDDYFVEGITEEINAKLAGIHGLTVIAPASAMKYKNSRRDVSTIAQELGAEYVLEGSVRWQQSAEAGHSRVRITPRLIHAKDETLVWSDTYDKTMADIFAVQSEIAVQVSAALKITLVESDRRSWDGRQTRSLEAYQYYLRGNEYFNRGIEKEDLQIASEMYDRSLAADSLYALAHAHRSWTHATIFWWYGHNRGDSSSARRSAQTALLLDPNLPDAHLAMGYFFYWCRRDYQSALREWQTALNGQPNNSDLLEAVGLVQRRQGEFESALNNLKKAVELDQRSGPKAWEVGNTLHRLRRWDEAESFLDRAIALAPDFREPYFYKISSCVNRYGHTSEARAVLAASIGKVDPARFQEDRAQCDLYDRTYQRALDELTAIANDTVWNLNFRGQIYRLMDRPEEASQRFDSARVILERGIPGDADNSAIYKRLGVAYAGLGRREDAIRSGQKAIVLEPLSKDAFYFGPTALENMALIYTMLGDYNLAIDLFDTLLSTPAGLITIPYLELDPRYADLVRQPRFQRLKERHAPS